MSAVRVMIVDDHPMVRRGLHSLLSAHSDIEVVGEAGTAADALRLASELSPDVILLDVQMPGPGGIDIVQQLLAQQPNTRVVILTAFDNDEYVLAAFRAGAHAYLLKSTSDETVVETVRLVHEGKRLLSPTFIDNVLRHLQDLAQAQVRRETDLSEEQLQVLKLIARGATNEEIAQEMFWSERTVKRKVEEIIVKLEARNRAHAVAEAIKRGLI